MLGMVFEQMADESSPIILIGAARSGTKFLRDVLATPQGVCCVPFDVNYVWRYGNEGYPHDALVPEQLSRQVTNYIKTRLSRLAKQKDGDVLVEKTVSNSLRVAFVDKVFPDARYVHLIRDGRDVAESAMRQWQAKPDLLSLGKKLRTIPLGSSSYIYWFARNFLLGVLRGRGGGGVWGPRFPGVNEAIENVSLAEVCALQWRESVCNAQHALREIRQSENRVITIRYEDLIQSECTLADLVERLHLPDAEAALQSYRAKKRPSVPDQWRLLSADDQAAINSIVDVVDIPDKRG